MNNMKIKIAHLYPKKMNIYGDYGNILILEKRCFWRNIKTQYVPLDCIDNTIEDSDIVFFGGGQDRDQMEVFEDLLKNKDIILQMVNDEKIFILICGGYQLFGKFFIDQYGNLIEGLDILDIETKAQGKKVRERCIGNLVIETGLDINPKTIVGFENHGGQTFLSKKMKPLGKVISGFGNNSSSENEGCIYKNIYGSYMHGPLLAKNPHLADYFITLALKNKYKKDDICLSKLDDSYEFKAHNNIKNL